MPRTVCGSCNASLGPLPPTIAAGAAPASAPPPSGPVATIFRRPSNAPGSYPSRDALAAALSTPTAPPARDAVAPVTYTPSAPSPDPSRPAMTYPLPTPPPTAAPPPTVPARSPPPARPIPSPGPSASGGPSSTPPGVDAHGSATRRRSQRRTIVVIAVAVVLVVVLAGVADVLLLRPAATGSTNGPAPVGQALDELAVARAGQTRENATAGGPWTPTALLGLGLATGYNGTPGFLPGCSTVWENSSNLVVPTTPAASPSGEVAGWMMFASGPSHELLSTAVYQTGATILASNTAIFQGSCTPEFTTFGAVPTGVVDSPTVVAAANALGGTSFLSTHSIRSVELLLLGPYWSVEYSTCSYFATSGTGSNFTALFHATTGVSLGAPTTTSGQC